MNKNESFTRMRVNSHAEEIYETKLSPTQFRMQKKNTVNYQPKSNVNIQLL